MRNPCSFRLIATEQTQGLGALRQRNDRTKLHQQLFGANDCYMVDAATFYVLLIYLYLLLKAPRAGR